MRVEESGAAICLGGAGCTWHLTLSGHSPVSLVYCVALALTCPLSVRAII